MVKCYLGLFKKSDGLGRGEEDECGGDSSL